MNYADFLTELGFTEVDECTNTITFATWDGTSYEIQKSDIHDTDTMRDVIRKSQRFSSCCGAEVDEDYCICPDCGEHC